MSSYIGANRLQYLWEKLKDKFVQKSSTTGLLKNDGTIDTSTYLTSSDIIGKEDKLSIISVGSLVPVYVKTGYRILYASTRGYYYSASSQSVVIFDVTAYKGKAVTATWKRVANSYGYAFVTDYTKIPSSNDLDTWNSILISSSGKISSADSALHTQTLTVPNSTEGSVYLCLSLTTSAGYDVTNTSGSSSSLTAILENYYILSNPISTFSIVLPAVTASVFPIKYILFWFTTGTTPDITWTSSNNDDIYLLSDFTLEANTTYEVKAIWNGVCWYLTYTKFVAIQAAIQE